MTNPLAYRTKTYAGIGSRRTPANICELMQQLGEKLAVKGAVLRSGGAEEADLAFERGCIGVGGRKEIYLTNEYVTSAGGTLYSGKQWSQAYVIAAKHHPSWSHLKPYSKKLHARNCFQVLGISLQSPADFVLCWTPDGAKTKEETSRETGGTGQAIRLASSHGIKVYNLANKDDLELVRNWLHK